jgi:hypothetical protein
MKPMAVKCPLCGAGIGEECLPLNGFPAPLLAHVPRMAALKEYRESQ